MRILHTMLRVTDLERSLNFYQHVLGMTLHRRKDYPEGKFTLAFLGYEDESKQPAIELTHNWKTDAYDLGNAYGHADAGGEIVRPASPMNHGPTISIYWYFY